MDFLSGLFDLVGGANGLINFGVFLVLAVAALALARFSNKKGGLTERVVNLASYAVLAVKKLADNGQYEGMSEAERHAAKKQTALNIIEEGLKAEGVTPNAALMAFAGFAIETALKMMENSTPETPAPEEHG